MQIDFHTSPYFGINLNSPKLKFHRKDFYVPIRGYGKNICWANQIKSTADTAVNLLRKNTTPENVMKYIVAGVSQANKLTSSISKQHHTGILRINREGWKNAGKALYAYTPYDLQKYNAYSDRITEIVSHPLKNPFDKLELTIPIPTKHTLLHSDPITINYALEHIFKKSADVTKFLNKNINENDLTEINNSIAEIRWILAHTTPWSRGSDAISNVYIRVLFKALGIKCYPLKKGISLDMEAFCTELSDYKKKFPTYFKKAPEIID